MRLQVLVAAVNADVGSQAERMNLESDAIIMNQCDHFAYEEYDYRGKKIRCYSLKERGVGLNRNNALLRCDSDICLFSDEDIVFDTGYEQKILDAFSQNPDADLITFNFRVDPSRRTYENRKKKRVRWYNYGRYPTYAVAARREALHRAGVTFSLLFGGGAPYSNGEDSLFLHDFLKKGLHIYADTAVLGEEVYRESTWFQGYTEKFFFDRGVLYAYLYGGLSRIFSLRFLMTKRKTICQEISVGKAYGIMKKGIRTGRNIRGGTGK